jgi:hypothetical protein|tara:strand:- start:667 stop:897 length:231 start_codon:yes stop_codon:yes gene_type:complete
MKFMPEHFHRIAHYENEFGLTIHRQLSVSEQASAGTPYEIEDHYLRMAMSDRYEGEIFTDNWRMPAGAFGENCGPV